MPHHPCEGQFRTVANLYGFVYVTTPILNELLSFTALAILYITHISLK